MLRLTVLFNYLEYYYCIVMIFRVVPWYLVQYLEQYLHLYILTYTHICTYIHSSTKSRIHALSLRARNDRNANNVDDNHTADD